MGFPEPDANPAVLAKRDRRERAYRFMEREAREARGFGLCTFYLQWALSDLSAKVVAKYLAALHREGRLVAPPRLQRVWHPDWAPPPEEQMSYRAELTRRLMQRPDQPLPEGWGQDPFALACGLGYRSRASMLAALDRHATAARSPRR